MKRTPCFAAERCHGDGDPRLARRSQTFSAWASDVHEHIRERNLLHRFKQRWLNLCAAAAFSAWCDLVDARRRTRQLMQLTITRLSNASLLRALASWRAVARSVGRGARGGGVEAWSDGRRKRMEGYDVSSSDEI